MWQLLLGQGTETIISYKCTITCAVKMVMHSWQQYLMLTPKMGAQFHSTHSPMKSRKIGKDAVEIASSFFTAALIVSNCTFNINLQPK